MAQPLFLGFGFLAFSIVLRESLDKLWTRLGQAPFDKFRAKSFEGEVTSPLHFYMGEIASFKM